MDEILHTSKDEYPESWTAVILPVVDITTEHTIPITGPRLFFSLNAL